MPESLQGRSCRCQEKWWMTCDVMVYTRVVMVYMAFSRTTQMGSLFPRMVLGRGRQS